MQGKFDTIINTDKPVLVDFYADWCGPCKAVTPVLKQVKASFNDGVRIIKVNVDNNPSLAGRFGIQSIPTLMLFRKGQTVWKGVGVRPVDEIRRVVEQAIG